MPDGKPKKKNAPDIFALMRADPPLATRAFTKADERLLEGEGERFFNLCMIWCDCFALPHVFAQRRRAHGDPSASPRDHECGCDVMNGTYVPVCGKRREGCKFEKPSGPPAFFRGGVAYEPEKTSSRRQSLAFFHALTAFLAFADASPAGRRAMERRILRALSSDRAGAVMRRLAGGGENRTRKRVVKPHSPSSSGAPPS